MVLEKMLTEKIPLGRFHVRYGEVIHILRGSFEREVSDWKRQALNRKTWRQISLCINYKRISI